MLNKNPYDVLGVSPDASDDEVKKAYRDMSRKYHPDANVNNPLADLAEEKFKEIQEAYDMIMKEREQGGGTNGGYQYGYGYGNSNAGGYGQSSSGRGYGGYQSGGGPNGGYQSGGYQSSDSSQDVKVQAAFNYINSGYYREALNVLNGMPNRNAQWYYLSAMANAGIGNNILARDHAGQAVNMEPNNLQYRQLLNQLDYNGQRYRNNPYGGGYGNGGDTCGTGNVCCDLWCADTLCECMGGDLCSCM